MTISQLLDLAKNGRLKNLSVKNDDSVIIGFLNLAIIELYKRFPIDTEEVIITLGSDGDLTNPYTMINDTIYQMPDNYMYLIAAYDEIPEGSLQDVNLLPINEEDNILSVNTISWNKVQIPTEVDGAHISLIYASTPTYYTVDDLSETLPLPAQMIEAVLLYIGYQAHESISSAENENNIYLQKFEKSIADIKRLGLFSSDDMNMSKRLDNRCFV